MNIEMYSGVRLLKLEEIPKKTTISIVKTVSRYDFENPEAHNQKQQFTIKEGYWPLKTLMQGEEL